MKKIVVLAIALALVVGMPLLASEFTFGGDLDWGVITNFDDMYNQGSGTATFDVKATVDDFNTVGVSFDVDAGTMEKAQIASNLGSALKLPLSLTAYAGYFDFGSEEYVSITGYDLGNVADFTGARWQWAAALGFADLVTVEVATSWDFVTNDADYWLGAHGVFGPVSAEAWYADTAADARVGADVLVTLAVMEGATLKVGGGLASGIDTEVLAYAAAAKFDYGMFGLGVDFSGADTDPAPFLLAVEASVTPVANLTLDVGALLDFTDYPAILGDVPVLNNIDASVAYKAGAVTWRVGYLYSDTDFPVLARWNAVALPEPVPDVEVGSGLYIKAGLDY